MFVEPALSEGSSRRMALPSDAACDPDQPTVISQRPPLASTPSRATSPSELSKQLAGEQLNHFQLLEYVGGGGMGAVFRALDTMLNREVALKVLSRDQGADDETRRRFQNEAQSAARLDHENIARVYYVGEDRGLNYIVFEFIEGTNLRDFVEHKGPLPAAEAVGYTLQVAHALAHASSRDVVHRDIKPSNLIITSDGRAKLVDMGLARLHQVQADGGDLTASGVTLGTFDYISPEQARDPRSADVRSDIYSLGCTLYYMLTGRPPFPDGTVLQKLLQHNSDPPPDPRELNPAVPPELSAVVSKMLAKDPLRRYQNPSELIGDLRLLAEQMGYPLPGTERAAWLPDAVSPPPSLVRHLPWLVPVAVLLLAVGLLDRPWPGLLDPASEESRSPARQPSRPAPPLLKKESSKTKANSRATELTDSPTGDGGAGANVTRDANDDALGTLAPSIDLRKTNSAPAADDIAASPLKGDSTGRSPAAVDSIGETIAAEAAVAGESRGSTGPFATSDPDKVPTNPAIAKRPADFDAEPPEALPPGLLVAGDGQKGPQRFANLAEACAAAKNGDTIELRYNGSREEQPLVFSELRLVVRAGDGYRPAVRFRPSDTNPVSYARGMLKINGGGLRLVGLEMELDLSRTAPSENWSLFELQSVESLWLDQCLLVVRNASNLGEALHDKVAFVRIDASPRLDMMMPGSQPPVPVQLTLRNCVARGEAMFVFDPDGQSMGLSWHNGLLASSERFLVVGATAATEPTETNRVRLDLKQLTVFTRQGFCRMGSGDAPAALPTVEVRSVDCLFASDGSEPALIDQTGTETANRLKSKLQWEAARDLYLGYRMFWKITSLAASAGEPEVATYTDWCGIWSSRETQTASTAWRGRRDLARRPLHLASLADFLLDENDLEGLPASPGEPPPGADAAELPAWLVP